LQRAAMVAITKSASRPGASARLSNSDGTIPDILAADTA
jgi:hypothetical protein